MSRQGSYDGGPDTTMGREMSYCYICTTEWYRDERDDHAFLCQRCEEDNVTTIIIFLANSGKSYAL